MHQNTRIILKIEHSLRWYQRPKIDHSLLIMTHLALVFNWISILYNIPPMLGILLATLLATIIKMRNNIFAKVYIRQIWERIVLSTLAFISLAAYSEMMFSTLFLENNNVWLSFGTILAFLSIYDTKNCIQGRLGLRFISALTEAIKIRKN